MSFENLKTNRTDVSKLVSAVQSLLVQQPKRNLTKTKDLKPTVDESVMVAVNRFLSQKVKNYHGLGISTISSNLPLDNGM